MSRPACIWQTLIGLLRYFGVPEGHIAEKGILRTELVSLLREVR